jgi:hypothetical protein
MVSRGTVEETVLALHARKRALASGVLENAAGGRPLETQDLLALLGATGPALSDEDSDEGDDAQFPNSADTVTPRSWAMER